jgi:hypothetical protein
MGNPLCHFEFMTNDVAKAKAFYGEVFDWRFDEATMPGYTLIHAGAEPGGGMFPKPPNAPGPCLNVYFLVTDIDATLARVTRLGGTVIVPKSPIPGHGQYAMFADPDGIAVGLFQPLAA